MGGSIKENLTGRADVQKPNESGPTGKIGNADASTLLISCGYWDETLKVHTVDGLRLKCSENGGHTKKQFSNKNTKMLLKNKATDCVQS